MEYLFSFVVYISALLASSLFGEAYNVLDQVTLFYVIYLVFKEDK